MALALTLAVSMGQLDAVRYAAPIDCRRLEHQPKNIPRVVIMQRA